MVKGADLLSLVKELMLGVQVVTKLSQPCHLKLFKINIELFKQVLVNDGCDANLWNLR